MEAVATRKHLAPVPIVLVTMTTEPSTAALVRDTAAA